MTATTTHVPVRLTTLRGDQRIPFDLYIYLNQRHILYIRAGDAFDNKRLQRLKAKKLRKMYIKPDDEDKYRQYLSTNIDIAYDPSSDKTLEQRCHIIHGLQQAVAEDVMENPEDKSHYSLAKDSVQRYIEFLLTEDEAIKTMLSFENDEKNLPHHGVAVATLSVAIAQELKLEEPRKLQLLTLGALIHDIGHMSSGQDLERPIDTLSESELKVYHEHPARGAEKAHSQPHFDATVLKIIQQHEEHIDGSGFPAALKQSQLDPLAVIVSSANALDRLISFEGHSATEAAKQLLIEKVGRHPLDQLQALQKTVKAQGL